MSEKTSSKASTKSSKDSTKSSSGSVKLSEREKEERKKEKEEKKREKEKRKREKEERKRKRKEDNGEQSGEQKGENAGEKEDSGDVDVHMEVFAGKRDWQSKYPTKSCGFYNTKGDSCYRNTVIQILVHIPVFVRWAEEYSSRHAPDGQCKKGEDREGKPVMCKLCLFFNLSQFYWHPSKGDKEQAYDDLWRLVLGDWEGDMYKDNRIGQQDAAEFWEELFSQFHEQIDDGTDGGDKDQMQLLFGHPLMRVRRCVGEDEEESQKCPGSLRSTRQGPAWQFEPGSLLRLPFPSAVDGVHKLSNAITEFFREKDMETSCQKCNLPRKMKMNFAFVPEVLTIQLNRVDYGNKRGPPTKIVSQIEFEEYIELPSNCFTWTAIASKLATEARVRNEELNEDTLLEDMENHKILYELVSVIVHEGDDFQSGHYSNYCKGPDGVWVWCNDLVITPVPNFETWATLKAIQDKAYMFFYRRYDKLLKRKTSHKRAAQDAATQTSPKRSKIGKPETRASDILTVFDRKSESPRTKLGGTLTIKMHTPDGTKLIDVEVPGNRITFPEDASNGKVEISWKDKKGISQDFMCVDGSKNKSDEAGDEASCLYNVVLRAPDDTKVFDIEARGPDCKFPKDAANGQVEIKKTAVQGSHILYVNSAYKSQYRHSKGKWKFTYTAPDGRELFGFDVPSDKVALPDNKSEGTMRITWTDKAGASQDTFELKGHEQKRTKHEGKYNIRLLAQDNTELFNVDVPSDHVEFPNNAASGQVEFAWRGRAHRDSSVRVPAQMPIEYEGEFHIN